MSFRVFPNITPNEPWGRVAAAILQWVRNGKLNCVGEVTLATGAATTTLTDALIGPDSVIILMPLTANAKAEGTPWQSAHATGSVTLNHVNSATTGRSYRYAVIG
jgi:hypothetical protein